MVAAIEAEGLVEPDRETRPPDGLDLAQPRAAA
jgi:hypothetical protein